MTGPVSLFDKDKCCATLTEQLKCFEKGRDALVKCPAQWDNGQVSGLSQNIQAFTSVTSEMAKHEAAGTDEKLQALVHKIEKILSRLNGFLLAGLSFQVHTLEGLVENYSENQHQQYSSTVKKIEEIDTILHSKKLEDAHQQEFELHRGTARRLQNNTIVKRYNQLIALRQECIELSGWLPQTPLNAMAKALPRIENSWKAIGSELDSMPADIHREKLKQIHKDLSDKIDGMRKKITANAQAKAEYEKVAADLNAPVVVSAPKPVAAEGPSEPDTRISRLLTLMLTPFSYLLPGRYTYFGSR